VLITLNPFLKFKWLATKQLAVVRFLGTAGFLIATLASRLVLWSFTASLPSGITDCLPKFKESLVSIYYRV
jgi:hypothetical protein